jgi:prepilin-type N-terminal cleavage/methylation domain-containing protein
MRHRCDNLRSCSRAFTLIELLVTITIISILASLSLAGLAVARQRVKADRTELTIRKIHEVIMPHYERFLTRQRSLEKVPQQGAPPQAFDAAEKQARTLLTVRRALVFEMPDGWADLLDSGTTPATPSRALNPDPPFTAIATRLRSMASAGLRDSQWSDAECLWTMVIRGGFADPAIVGHFREDEFGDKNGNGEREFLDGWGNPIRFLRWAPAFVSRYQPTPGTGADTRSHDSFDPRARDPLARITLFPLIFSTGGDGEPGIACRTSEGTFSYPKVAFDPYFATRQTGFHLVIKNSAGANVVQLGPYASAQASPYTTTFGTTPPNTTSDDVHNHAMSR